MPLQRIADDIYLPFTEGARRDFSSGGRPGRWDYLNRVQRYEKILIYANFGERKNDVFGYFMRKKPIKPLWSAVAFGRHECPPCRPAGK